MGSRYWELTVAVPPDASEGLTNFVWELGALGVVEEEQPAGPAQLRAFFSDVADSRAIVKSVDVYLGALHSLGFSRAGSPAAAPVVLANLLAAAHRALAPSYIRLVAAGGTLVAGGCLDAEADDVTVALAGHGFRRLDVRSIDGWTTLAYEHAPLHDRA